MHAGHNVWVQNTAWEATRNSSKDSLFCKSVAVALWTTETLAQRSVTGKLSNSAIAEDATNAFPPLTPENLNALKCKYMFFYWCILFAFGLVTCELSDTCCTVISSVLRLFLAHDTCRLLFLATIVHCYPQGLQPAHIVRQRTYSTFQFNAGYHPVAHTDYRVPYLALRSM